MIVDCHTHISCKVEEFDESAYLEATEPVDMSVVLPFGGVSGEEANRVVSEYVGRHTEKMVGFGVVEPTEDAVGVKSIGALREKLGLKGVVLYCCRCGFHPAHSRAMRLYETAEELGLPVFFHNTASGAEGVLEYSQPYLLDEVARTFGGLKIVVGSMGMPFFEQTLWLVGKHKNVYADLTVRPGKVWQVYNVVVGAYEQGVMDKLLFGSGFPAASAGECMETLLGFNKLLGEANLPTVPRGAIRGVIERDTLKLLGIEH